LDTVSVSHLLAIQFSDVGIHGTVLLAG